MVTELQTQPAVRRRLVWYFLGFLGPSWFLKIVLFAKTTAKVSQPFRNFRLFWCVGSIIFSFLYCFNPEINCMCRSCLLCAWLFDFAALTVLSFFETFLALVTPYTVVRVKILIPWWKGWERYRSLTHWRLLLLAATWWMSRMPYILSQFQWRLLRRCLLEISGKTFGWQAVDRLGGQS